MSARKIIAVCSFLLIFLGMGCAGTGSGSGMSREGSEPANHKERIRYKQALIRCHKTGGSRIVKINGSLRCF